jgi:acetyl-CoA/propionyl-CoA carboxylase, biotin carboxylase, biotin carboxyl carrier protein
VMEAMKMELALTAPFDGTVTTVGVEPGQQVSLGATLFVVTEVPDTVGATATTASDGSEGGAG